MARFTTLLGAGLLTIASLTSVSCVPAAGAEPSMKAAAPAARQAHALTTLKETSGYITKLRVNLYEANADDSGTYPFVRVELDRGAAAAYLFEISDTDSAAREGILHVLRDAYAGNKWVTVLHADPDATTNKAYAFGVQRD